MTTQHKKEVNYAYSMGEEWHGDYNCTDEAIEGACKHYELEIGDPIMVSKIVEVSNHDLAPSYNSIVEFMQEKSCHLLDKQGICYDSIKAQYEQGFPQEIPKKEEDVVVKEVMDVFVKHKITPRLFIIEELQEYKITSDHKE